METPRLPQQRCAHTFIRLCAFAAFIFGSPAFANPVANANFETALGTTDWVADNTLTSGVSPAPVRVAGTRPGGVGSWVLETSGRDDSRDGPMQSSANLPALKFALGPAPTGPGNNRTYTTRVWVKLDASAAEASFRCYLRWRDNGVAQIPLLLAEVVIRQPGVWVEATGTATLAWTTSLSTAIVDFEVEQLHKGGSPTPPPTWFPSYQIDDLQMELDDDGDGLWNSEESSDHSQSTLSFSDVVDSDGDRLPDDWEYGRRLGRYGLPGLNPRDPADAALDPDGDGFTHLQEYFAATDPYDAANYPGRPCDPQATHLTRALLRYLALRPTQQNALCGQMISDNATEYSTYVAALAAQTGRWPAMLGIAVEIQDAPLDIAASIDHAITYTQAGGIAQLKWAMWNPWRAHLYVQWQQIGFPGDLLKIDIPGLLDPSGTPTISANTAAENLAARATVLGWVDAVATEIKRYNAATGSQPLLFRPLSEMNGGWFWWGHRTHAEYTGLWNLIYDRLTQPAALGGHDLHNLIWVYESASSEHVPKGATDTPAASDYYYPGDDRVDVMAHNLYDADWVLSWDANKVYARYPKIYAVPQAGPALAYPWRTGIFDNLTYPTQIAARFPRLSFFIVWNSFSGNQDDDNNPATDPLNDDPVPATPDDPLQHHSIIDNLNATALLTHFRIITRDELAWLPPLQPAALAATADTLLATWTDPATPAPANGVNETGYRLEIAPAANGPWLIATNTAPDSTLAQASGLSAGTHYWLRVRTLYPGGEDSLPTDPIAADTWTLFTQWRYDHFSDPATPPDADPDGDGSPAALEYLLATDPQDPASHATPTASCLQVNSNTYLALTFRRRIVPGGLSHAVQASGDLADWSEATVLATAPINHGDGTETVTYRDLIPISSAPTRFLRLQVTLP